MIGTIVAAALWALVASLVFSGVLGGLVAGTIALTRPSAATRHLLWSIALAAAGLAPVVILAMMLLRGTAVAPQTPSAEATATVHGRQAAAGAPARSAAAVTDAAANARSGEMRLPGPPGLTPIAASAVAAMWALGALIGLIGLARSIARVRGLKGRSSPLDGTLATELPWLTTTTGREIYLRLSYETETPIAVGFRRPVVLLPTEMATAGGLTSIEPLIMHEYAHLARYDDWSNLAQRAIERIFWFNPLVWVLGRRIALEREVAADEAVVARTHDAKRYAATLWRMAQEMRMPEHVVVAPGAMLTRKQISVRIERLLEENGAGPRRAGAAAFAIAIVAVTGVGAIAASAPPIALPQATLAALQVGSPTAKVEPLILPKIVPLPPASPRKAAASQKPAARGARDADDDAIAVDSERLSEHIQSNVQRQLAGVLGRHGVLDAEGTKGPITRRLVGGCLGCDFSHRDLQGIDLSNMSLVGDDFSYADLRGANLRGSKLTGIDFNHAVLDDADLSQATFMGVDFKKTSLQGANTTGIRLIGSSLP